MCDLVTWLHMTIVHFRFIGPFCRRIPKKFSSTEWISQVFFARCAARPFDFEIHHA